MAVTKKLVKVDCPFKGCPKALKAEVSADWDKFTDEQAEDLRTQVRNQLLPGLKKHHKDGHPK
jgi:hypothetical protein